MSSVAVLICMASDADHCLALSAVSSTAEALRHGDAVFLHVDGANNCPEDEFRKECGNVPIHFVYSSERAGLASGLNKLIDVCLESGNWDYIGRMDADDRCLPGRFEKQRGFFSANPETDILGGLSNEVDEGGRHLRTKNLPLKHEQILAHLPKRNPINHPTVIVRRRVFDSGLRYRSDVGLVEDWQLWVDAAARNFRFSNLNEPVLSFLRSSSFFRKRGGLSLAAAEWRVRRLAMQHLQMTSPSNLIYAFFASGMRLAPPMLQRVVYRLAD
jgi:glycosyltransferase involved in cell wall biosynthesis